HKEDALTYAQSFIYKANRKLGKHVIGITTQAEQLLLDYHWPGNIRELRNVIEMAMDSVEGDMLNIKDFASLVEIVNKTEEIHYREPMALDELEKRMIRLALDRYGNSVEGKKRAAGVLNISLATLYNKLKTLEDNV
ncbi:MAG: helix-turn-helix domain-containing protein, partial [Bacillota bacterium]